MRLREINSPGELAVDPDLIDRFTQAGWQIDGEGQDQLVMSKPGSNTVLKIVGSGSLPRQAQIRRYVEFFRANQRDPHFPRVGADRELAWKGRKYYAYTQERLLPLSGDEKVMDYLQYAMAELGHDQEPDFERIPPGLSVEQIEGLIGSVDHMFQSGLGGQYGFDLGNMANIMQRQDGQLVIVDPFSSFDESAEQPLQEIGDQPAAHEPNRRRSRSLFHATVNDHWVDVFFDRSDINDTLHITFTVDNNYDAPDQPTTASRSVIKILSTVLNIIQQRLPGYMAKARPPAVSFTARGHDRARLYRKYFVPVIERILGPGWELKEFPSMGMTVFNWRPRQRTDEVQILAKVKGKGSEPGQIPKYGRPISPDQEVKYLGQQVGRVGPYQLWRDWLGGQLSYHVFDPESRTVVLTTFGSRYHRNPNSYIIHGLYAAPGNPVKAHQFYRNLILDQGLTLISDRKQSPGGNRVWQRLEAYPDIEVYGFDTKTGEVMNFGAADAEMYAVPPRAAKDRESRYIAKNIRLVATAR